MVEEDPEDFLGDVDDFFAPDAVGPGVIDGSDEARRLSFFRRIGVVEVGEEGAGSGEEEVRRGGGEVGEKETNDYAAGGELAGAFFLFVEEHGEKGRKKGRLDGGEVVEGERGSAESLEAEQCLVEDGVLMFLSRCDVSLHGVKYDVQRTDYLHSTSIVRCSNPTISAIPPMVMKASTHMIVSFLSSWRSL